MERALSPATAAKVRPMEARDIPQILAIQSASPAAAQWESSAYENLSAGQFEVFVAECDTNGLCGFVVARCAAGELEILNIAVAGACRRKGIGTALLHEVLGCAMAKSAATAFLEVRASNVAAVEFYTRHCFQLSGRRRSYYQFPSEDALLLSRLV